MLVNRAMQQGAGVQLGDEAEFVLEADLDPREAELPDELAVLLDEEQGLREWFGELTEYMRREIGKWVMGVKSDEARMRRAEQTAERLLSAMEGERELPPVIAAALRARPKARAGWAKMTAGAAAERADGGVLLPHRRRRGRSGLRKCATRPRRRHRQMSRLHPTHRARYGAMNGAPKLLNYSAAACARAAAAARSAMSSAGKPWRCWSQAGSLKESRVSPEVD